jgi:predicted transcriptional regulator
MTIDVQAQEAPPTTKYKDKLNDGFYVYVPKKQKIKDSFVMMFQEKLQELAAENLLTVEGYRVLLAFIAKTDFENFIHVKQVQLAADLGMQKQNVNKAFKRLIELNIIEKISHDNINGYRLNYEMGWKGKASNLKTHMKDQSRAKIIKMAEHAKKADKATDEESLSQNS